MVDEEPLKLGIYARIALAAFGLAVLAAAVPVGFYCLYIGGVLVLGWHGVVPRPIDRAAGLALIAFPLLMLALGVTSLLCSNRRRLAVAGALALALGVDGAAALYLLPLTGRHDHPCCVTAYPDVESAEAARKGLPPPPPAKAMEPGGPQSVSVACSPITGRCVSTKTKAK